MATAASAPAAQLTLRHVLDIDVDFEPVPTFATPLGTRMLFAARTGTFHGPDLAGTVLPGSADWLAVGADGVARLDVRAVLRTDDGEHILMSATGRAVLGEHVDRFIGGERVTAEQAYVRAHPLFDTAAPRYAHLNRIATVAYCDISLTAIHYRIHAVD